MSNTLKSPPASGGPFATREPKITSIATFELSFTEPTEIALAEGYRILDVVVEETTRLGVGNAPEMRRKALLPIIAAWDGEIVEHIHVRGCTATMPVADTREVLSLMAIGTCLDATGERWWFFATPASTTAATAWAGKTASESTQVLEARIAKLEADKLALELAGDAAVEVIRSLEDRIKELEA